jgi:hypothetical protein
VKRDLNTPTAEAAPKTAAADRQSLNVAARMGRWSAQHRKTAIWGWLAFVIVAFMIGGSVGTKTLDNAHSGVGESGRAARTADAAFPKSADEMVLVQSATVGARTASRSVLRSATPSSACPSCRTCTRSRARTRLSTGRRSLPTATRP